MESNPELIQPEDWTNSRSIPAILMHDGGGTTFAYHCLNSLSRPVYGIYNPNFRSGEPFEGGLSDLARLYCGFVKEVVKSPEFPKRRNAEGKVRVIFGGWSFGGHLSLEMAKQLDQDDSGVQVVGILMVDTIFPVERSKAAKITNNEATQEGKTKNQLLADRAMTDARRMITEWTPPVWEDGQRPRTVLVRAKERVPMEGDGVSLVDLSRDERNIGWDAYEKDMFADVIDAEGHHFNLFSLENLEGITKAMKEGMVELELASLEA
ncbi:hypothetical protein N0V84_000489 [Fusarium piperis]|uniref:Thioesterase domain-containing protein n=1 Tax=Fusarium piperis TaxID=1435070 RepID=A0A9W8WMT3_9HYPO|nr:hypothetical protein N0V84_000489 [Fusarium piperis]